MLFAGDCVGVSDDSCLSQLQSLAEDLQLAGVKE